MYKFNTIYQNTIKIILAALYRTMKLHLDLTLHKTNSQGCYNKGDRVREKASHANHTENTGINSEERKLWESTVSFLLHSHFSSDLT